MIFIKVLLILVTQVRFPYPLHRSAVHHETEKAWLDISMRD
jgi:hypothetical protein